MSLIIAVAGHINHGKTALVRALTGVDTDRLPEERRRGISIEAGFAHWRRTTAGAQPLVSFVDVPGHERYIRNMVAGIQGAQAALLVIACDDGVMPQTREHAEILRLMGIDHWLVALTKSDRLDPVQTADRTASVRAWLASEAIDAEVIAVSAHTGFGIPALASRIEAFASNISDDSRQDTHRTSGKAARLCVDKSFIASGDGLVITGVLTSGVLRVGDSVVVSPAGRQARVRGLQVAGHDVREVKLGSRCAVNLAGSGVGRHVAGRGDWIVSSELHHPVSVVDVHLHWSRSLEAHRTLTPGNPPQNQDGGADRPVRLPADIQVHAGTARLSARIAALHVPIDALGHHQIWARLRLAQPASAVVGDRWILRNADGSRTLGTAEVVWPVIAADGLRGPAHAALLRRISRTTPESWLASALAELSDGMAPARFAAAWALTDDAANASWEDAGAVLIRQSVGGLLFDRARLNQVSSTILAAVDAWHQQTPESLGMNWAAVLGTLNRRDSRRYAGVALSALQAAGELTQHGDRIFRPNHIPAPTAEDDTFRLKALPILTERRSRSVHELSELLETPLEEVRSALDRLAMQGYAVAVTPQRFLAVAQIEALAAAATAIAASGELRAGDFSRATGIGRNLGIDVLEFFDRIRFTRRLGNRRIVIDDQALSRAIRSKRSLVPEVA